MGPSGLSCRRRWGISQGVKVQEVLFPRVTTEGKGLLKTPEETEAGGEEGRLIEKAVFLCVWMQLSGASGCHA